MKTITEHIRQHLYGRFDLIPPKRVSSYEELARTEWSEDFERYMRNRMIMGALRYARLHDKNAPPYDAISSLLERAKKYLEDGNQEHLVDVANYALLEFCRPCCHPNPTFRPTDDAGIHSRVMK